MPAAPTIRERLVALAVFGSVARGTMRPDSDIDTLIVARDLPGGRMACMRDFEGVEASLDRPLAEARRTGVHTTLSPIFRAPEEVAQGSPLFLDMTHSVRILFDQNRFLQRYLDDLRHRLTALGARRIEKGDGYYWVLKPDLKPGEEIVL
jgi:predicted nucleotidyltransferase